MSSFRNIARYARARWVAPLIAVLCLAITLFAWTQSRNAVIDEYQQQFDQEIEIIEEAIQNRFNVYVTALESGRALLDASDFVSRDEWRIFASSLNLETSFPGIQGYGYAEVVPAPELDEHIARVRNEGFPDFVVRPVGERPVYTSIVYLEPFDERNQQAFGFDMFSEDVRRTAMSQARDTGETWMSGRVMLVQEIDADVQAGFLVYVPDYVNGASVETLEDRQAAIQGYVYAPFRARDFMEGIIGNREQSVHFMIFDGANATPREEVLMYTSGATVADIATAEEGTVQTRTIVFNGHPWTLYFTPIDTVSYYNSWLILIFGSIITLLILIVINGLARGHERAQQIADAMVEDLENTTRENETIHTELESTNAVLVEQKEQLQQKLAELERLNKVMVNRELKMVEMKKQMQQHDPEQK